MPQWRELQAVTRILAMESGPTHSRHCNTSLGDWAVWAAGREETVSRYSVVVIADPVHYHSTLAGEPVWDAGIVGPSGRDALGEGH